MDEAHRWGGGGGDDVAAPITDAKRRRNEAHPLPRSLPRFNAARSAAFCPPSFMGVEKMNK